MSKRLRRKVSKAHSAGWESLASLGEETLQDALAEQDVHTRSAAVDGLVAIGTGSAIDAVVGALQDPERDVRLAAVMALGRTRSERAVLELIATLRDTKEDEIVRGTAAYGLGQMGSATALEPLLAAVNDPDFAVSDGAKDGLRAMGVDHQSSSMEPAAMEPAAMEPASAEPIPPNDALRALQSRLEQLTAAHPRRENAILDPKLDQQLPWICRTLDEAASALESGIDPFGNPITNPQIANGLRTLRGMVGDREYLTAMEIGHPGVAKPLEQCMEELDEIIGGIEGPSSTATRATELYTSSKGVATLIDLCTEGGILFGNFRGSPDAYEMYRHALHSEDYEVRGNADAVSFLRSAMGELQREGESGSRALAALVRELLRCRSSDIIYALVVVGDVNSTPELLDSLDAVAHSSELTEAPSEALFTPGIAGEGRVGWTDYKQVVGIAGQARAELEDRG